MAGQMEVGRLDQRITFQRQTDTADGVGGTVKTWADLSSVPSVWANVVAKSGREAMNDGRMQASYVSVFTVHNRADILETDRIMFGGTPYNIRGIRREGTRNLFLVIEAERGVAS